MFCKTVDAAIYDCLSNLEGQQPTKRTLITILVSVTMEVVVTKIVEVTLITTATVEAVDKKLAMVVMTNDDGGKQLQ